MSTFRVTSIDVDKDPCKLSVKELPLDALQNQVSNYLDYMQTKTGLQRDSITCTMTLDRALIEEMLSLNQGAEGIRIYLTKDSGDTNKQDDISFLAVPVRRRRATDGLFAEMTAHETSSPENGVSQETASQETGIDTSTAQEMAFDATTTPESLLAFKADCPTGACPPGTAVIKGNHTLFS
jgi:hypothetical protein